MTTLTAHTAVPGVQPRGNHAGVDAVKCEYSVAAAISAGDVMVLGKVPSGSTLVGLYHKGYSAAGNDATVSYSLAGTVLGAQTGETPAWVAHANVPLLVSLSDDAVPLHSFLKATVSAVTSATAGGVFACTMFLTRDH